jgi:hypothetical protein
MSAYYEVYGTIRVRKCPDAEAIIARLRDGVAGNIDVNVGETDPDVLDISLEGGSSFAAGGVLDLDDQLRSLGPYAVEPASLDTRYDEEDGELLVARDDAECRAVLSRHRLDQIDVLLRDVTPDDRLRLADRLRTG